MHKKHICVGWKGSSRASRDNYVAKIWKTLHSVGKLESAEGQLSVQQCYSFWYLCSLPNWIAAGMAGLLKSSFLPAVSCIRCSSPYWQVSNKLRSAHSLEVLCFYWRPFGPADRFSLLSHSWETKCPVQLHLGKQIFIIAIYLTEEHLMVAEPVSNLNM